MSVYNPLVEPASQAFVEPTPEEARAAAAVVGARWHSMLRATVRSR